MVKNAAILMSKQLKLLKVRIHKLKKSGDETRARGMAVQYVMLKEKYKTEERQYVDLERSVMSMESGNRQITNAKLVKHINKGKSIILKQVGNPVKLQQVSVDIQKTQSRLEVSHDIVHEALSISRQEDKGGDAEEETEMEAKVRRILKEAEDGEDGEEEEEEDEDGASGSGNGSGRADTIQRFLDMDMPRAARYTSLA